MPRIVKNPDERRRELLVTGDAPLRRRSGYDRRSRRGRWSRAAGVCAGSRLPLLRLEAERVRTLAIEQYSTALRRGHHSRSSTTEASRSTRQLDRAIEAGPTPARSTTPTSSTRRATARSTTGSRWACARRCSPISARRSSSTRCSGAAPGATRTGSPPSWHTGCIGLASGPGMPDEGAVKAAKRYFAALVAEFRSGEKAD